MVAHFMIFSKIKFFSHSRTRKFTGLNCYLFKQNLSSLPTLLSRGSGECALALCGAAVFTYKWQWPLNATNFSHSVCNYSLCRCDVIAAMKLLLRFLFLALVLSASIFYFLHSDSQTAVNNVRNGTSSSTASQQTSQANWVLPDAPAASQLIDPKAQIKG